MDQAPKADLPRQPEEDSEEERKLAASVVVVLERIQSAGNLGRICRTLRTTGIDELRLVAPWTKDFEEARKLAVHAGGLLERAWATPYPDLESALEDRTLVIGTSEPGARERPPLRLRQGARALASRISSTAPPHAALVFGSERWGLSNAALDRCHELWSIPSHRDYPSLNLGHAVQVVLYELRESLLEVPPAPTQGTVAHEVIPQAVFDRVINYLGQAAQEIDFATTEGQRIRTEGHVRAILQGRGNDLDFERLVALSGKIARQLHHRGLAASRNPEEDDSK